MRMARICAVLTCCILVGATAMAADWPRFMGPSTNGIAPDEGINRDWNQRPPAELWRVELADGGYAGPSVADGKVFVIDHAGDEDIVRALDLATGQEVWHYSYADTGKPNYGFARSTPVHSNGMLYTLGRLGQLNCLNAKTGELVWSRDLVKEFGGKRPGWDYAASPFVDGEKLIVCPGGDTAGVAALDRATGETLWTGGQPGAPGYATPVVATINGTRQYVIFTATELTGVASETGELLWTYPWETKYAVNAAMPLVIGDAVFVTSNYGYGCALINITDAGAELSWESKDLQSHFNSPILYNGHIYGIGNPGFLVCINPDDGTLLWKQQGFERGGLAIVDGAIIALDGKNGALVLAEASPDGYSELGRITPLGGQSWTAPIVADGKLIVRNKEAMVCLDLM